MRCYGKRFKDGEAYYVKYAMNMKKGHAVWGVTSEWRALREQCLGASEGRKIKKIIERLSRLWEANKQHSADYLSLVLVHERITHSFMLSKAVDFIVFFGVSGMAYGCPYCLETPTNPKMWARLVRARQDIEDPVQRALELEQTANSPEVSTSRAA